MGRPAHGRPYPGPQLACGAARLGPPRPGIALAIVCPLACERSAVDADDRAAVVFQGRFSLARQRLLTAGLRRACADLLASAVMCARRANSALSARSFSGRFPSGSTSRSNRSRNLSLAGRVRAVLSLVFAHDFRAPTRPASSLSRFTTALTIGGVAKPCPLPGLLIYRPDPQRVADNDSAIPRPRSAHLTGRTDLSKNLDTAPANPRPA
jgi:hypothetical protein